MPLEAVFFDLDGTLLDTSVDLGQALNKLRAEENLPNIEQAVIRGHVSNGANALIRLGFGDALSEAEFLDYRQRLLAFYAEDIASHTCPFPGIDELLSALGEHRIPWGIVTNKPRTYTDALMQHIRFDHAPATVVSPEHVGVSKPSPEPLLYACREAGVNPRRSVYIGDHERDVACGRNADMTTIAVGYGFIQDCDEYLTWNADHTAATAHDIWPILQNYL